MRTKDIFFYVMTLIILSLMGLLIYFNKPKQSGIIISAKTSYYMLYDEEKPLDVMIFVSDSHSPLKNDVYYDDITLYDDLHQSISIDTFEIKKGHMESFLNHVFQAITLRLYLPYIGEDQHMHDVYIKITLTNGKTYTLPIGDLYIIQPVHKERPKLPYTSLYGLKKPGVTLTRLYEIHIHLEKMITEVESIDLGDGIPLIYEINEMILKIQIPIDVKRLFDVPLRIRYIDGQIDYMDNFCYIIDYQILKESGPILHVITTD